MIQGKRVLTFGYLAAAGALLLTTPLPLSAQIGSAKPSDARVRRALQQTDLKYSVNKDGDYVLHFDLANNRTHLVFIESNTEQWGNMEIRVVRAAAYIDKRGLTRLQLEKLLRDTARHKSGAWELIEDDETQAAQFTVKLSAECDPEALKTVVWGVAITADNMEKELSKNDNL